MERTIRSYEEKYKVIDTNIPKTSYTSEEIKNYFRTNFLEFPNLIMDSVDNPISLDNTERTHTKDPYYFLVEELLFQVVEYLCSFGNLFFSNPKIKKP